MPSFIWPDPPPPLSFDEFKKRREKGARTFEEINPELIEWLKKYNRREAYSKSFVIMIIVIYIIFICYIQL